jgi:hypothetical protein
MGVHPTPSGYSAYQDVIDKLMARGIPRQEIAAIGEADTDAKKQALFEKVRAGSVRVLLGSTQKMGTGTNVQQRLVALHHLDAPWKPAEIEQREGRILRHGNPNEEVTIYRYVTQRSFDSYMWQALETKARFIAQVMTGDSAVRRADDIGGQEFSYAEVKAIASGNPAVLTLAEADADLQRLTVLKKHHTDEQYLARRRLRELPETIACLERRVHALSQDIATARTHAAEPIAIGERICKREEALDLLAARLKSLPAAVHEARNVPLGCCRGLRFGLALSPHGVPEVFVEGAAMRLEPLSREFHGPRAILNAVERLIGSYDAQCGTAKKNLTIAQDQLSDYQARLGTPFPHETYLTELTGLRDQLKAALSITTPDPEAKPLPPAHELAERIKALKAAHTIEAASQRLTTHSAARAEEPIAARIRHRVKEPPTPEPETEPTLPASPPRPSRRTTPSAPTRHAQPALFEAPALHASVARRPPAKVSHQELVSPDERPSKRQSSLF